MKLWSICPYNFKQSRFRSCRGAALIMVLASLLALSGLVLKAMETTTSQSREMSLLNLEYQSGVLARAGLDVALELLAENEIQDLPPVQQEWARTWKDKGLTINIAPCSARLNLNILARDWEDPERSEQAVLTILEDKGLGRDEMEHLLYWMGVLETEGHGRPGLERVYEDKNLDYAPPRRDLSRPEELLLVPGFRELSPDWVREYFTVWGEPEKIDLNFVSREVALALLPELEPYWGRLESMRQGEGITHANQLLETGMDIDLYNRVLPYVTFDPNRFEILVEVREGAWYEKHRYIVEQDPMDPDSSPEVLFRDVLEGKQL